MRHISIRTNSNRPPIAPSSSHTHSLHTPPHLYQITTTRTNLTHTPQEVAKKRTRRTVKQQRGIVGASLDVIKERRSQRPEARAAARQQAIASGKAKKSEEESKKKAEKAKTATKTGGTSVNKVSKQQAKGAAPKVQARTR